MRILLTICCVALLQHSVMSEESGWSWNKKDTKKEEKEEAKLEENTTETQERSLFNDDQEFVAINETEVETIIEDILSSTRQGRNLQGYDEVYTDPELQEAIQKGDNTEARNIIKEKLCSLGLMQCTGGYGKRPYFSPDQLIYAQPVALKPVGRPIATVPVRGPPSPYGAPKPMPFPPAPSAGFGLPRPGQVVPPRRGYGPNYKPTASGSFYEGHQSTNSFVSSKPIGPIYEPIEVEEPYKFVPPPQINHKEIIVNGATSNAGLQQHVHHHYHHGSPSDSKISSLPENHNLYQSAAAAGSVIETGYNPYNTHKDVTSATFGNSNNGLGPYTIGIKPVVENYAPQSFAGTYGSNTFGASVGSYGSSSPFYKKELNLNRPLNGNSLQYAQSAYADKYKGFETIKSENYDCVCVPFDQCPTQDVIGRKEDFYLPLDPRNLKSDIEALSDEVVVTDGNGTMTVVRVPKEVSEQNQTSVETDQKQDDVKKVTKRETKDEEITKEKSKVEPRQAYFGNGLGNQNTCGPRHVCCRRPLRPQVPIPGNGRQCGTRHAQGINGRIKNPAYADGDSEFGEYPWQVAILKKDPKESVYVCGGTLIDSFHILTAAHCVKMYNGFDLRVRLGEWDVNHDVEFYPYIERDIQSVHIHPEFYAGTLYNDLAVLRMNVPVDWTKSPHISPACLPDSFSDFTGARCWTTGWGKDAFGEYGKYQNILKEVDVPIMSHANCQARMRQTRLGYDFQLHPGFVCAGGEEGKDACKGDGGGPMVCERGGSWQLVGIVSWGIGCGQPGVPGVYVKVAHYLDWIKQITNTY